MDTRGARRPAQKMAGFAVENSVRYEVIDGFSVTGCPYRPDHIVGGFACVMCEHWQSVSIHISGARPGDPGRSTWDVGCKLENIRSSGSRHDTEQNVKGE